jgi:hypothetical protein
MSGRKYPGLALFLISFVSLFMEMFLIRWNPACSKTVGYYTNLILISCFLGLGVGMAGGKAGKSRWFEFPFLFLVLNLALWAMNKLGTFPFPSAEQWGERLFTFQAGLIPSFLVIPVAFVLNALAMIPLGREIGRLIDEVSGLRSYLINLAGSFLGTAIFGLINFLYPHPLLFAALGCALYLLFLWACSRPAKTLAFSLVAFVLSLGAIFMAKGDSFWSPYYKIQLIDFSKPVHYKGANIFKGLEGFALLNVNDDYHQYILDLSPQTLERVARTNPLAFNLFSGFNNYYSLPYRFLNGPGRVLILGAGTGNDVDFALRSPASRIDAVEIDPMIARIGIKQHPNHPYQSARVRLHINDARNYLEKTTEKYDLIVYAFLDSHTLFSSLSSVRLENFVYTYEGIQAAADHLNPNGVMVIMFAASKDFVSSRLFRMAEKAFPGRAYSMQFNVRYMPEESFDIVIAGPGLNRLPAFASEYLNDNTAARLKSAPDRLPGDNWPFLYMTRSGLRASYAQMLVLLLLISALFIRVEMKGFKVFNWHFFFLGTGFLFLETKGITQLSLLFGSTWVVSAVVISSFLVMAMLSTIAAFRLRPENKKWIYPLIFLALAADYFFPFRSLLGLTPALKLVLAGGLISLPVFFSGLIFALSFKASKNQSSALGSNLLGSMLGGFAEYLTVIWGFQALWLLAIGFYFLAMVSKKE